MHLVTAIVPVTVISTRQSSTDDTIHPRYHGTAFFRNTFKGMLPATDYPKVNVCFFPLNVNWTTHDSGKVLFRNGIDLHGPWSGVGMAVLETPYRIVTNTGYRSREIKFLVN